MISTKEKVEAGYSQLVDEEGVNKQSDDLWGHLNIIRGCLLMRRMGILVMSFAERCSIVSCGEVLSVMLGLSR